MRTEATFAGCAPPDEHGPGARAGRPRRGSAGTVPAPLPSPPPLGEGVRLLPPAVGGWEGLRRRIEVSSLCSPQPSRRLAPHHAAMNIRLFLGGRSPPRPSRGWGMGKPGFPIPLRGGGMGKPGFPIPLLNIVEMTFCSLQPFPYVCIGPRRGVWGNQVSPYPHPMGGFGRATPSQKELFSPVRVRRSRMGPIGK